MKLLISVITTLLFVAMATVALIEFLSGCGETYIDAKGQRHAYGCVFFNTK